MNETTKTNNVNEEARKTNKKTSFYEQLLERKAINAQKKVDEFKANKALRIGKRVAIAGIVGSVIACGVVIYKHAHTTDSNEFDNLDRRKEKTMNEPLTSKIGSAIVEGFEKNGPGILAGLSVLGVFTTAALAVAATPKAMVDMVEASEDGEELRVKDVVKLCWKHYVPAVISGISTSAGIIGSHALSQRKIAALSAAYALTNETYRRYRDKMTEVVGKAKAEQVDEAVAESRLREREAEGIGNNEVIIMSGDKSLFMDSYSGRFFENDIESLRKAQNNLNAMMLDEMFISLNELYYEIGLKPVKGGDDIGWNIGREGLIDFKFGTCLSEDGKPCIVLDYYVGPRENFINLH